MDGVEIDIAGGFAHVDFSGEYGDVEVVAGIEGGGGGVGPGVVGGVYDCV